MKVRCSQSDLTLAVNSAARALSTRGVMTGGLVLTARTEEVRVKGPGPDLQVQWSVPAKVIRSGKAVAPVRIFTDLVSVMDPADVLLTADSHGQLRIQGVGIDSSIPTLPLDSIPKGLEISAGWIGQINASELLRACTQVRVAAARGEAKPVLTGVLARFDKSDIVLAATDGTRLAQRRLQAAATTGSGIDIVVPAKAIAEIERLLEHADETVDCKVDTSGKGLSLFATRFQIDVVGMDGTYPAYSRLLPTTVTTTCTLDADELLRRLVAAAMFAPDEGRRVTLQFQSQLGLTIRGTAPDRGTSLVTVVATITGTDIEVLINPDHLEAGLRVIGSKEVVLEISAGRRILTMRPSPHFDYLYLVMPMVQ